MSSLKVSAWDFKKDGAVTVESLGQKLQQRGYQYLQHVYEAGTVLQEHAHAEPRKDAVVSGKLKVSMSGAEVILTRGAILDIPVGVEHTATVVGDEPATVLEGALVDIPVEHWRPERDGHLTAETMARKLASYGFTYMQQIYGPGSVLSDHAHREPTRDAIVSGHLQVSMFGKEVKLGPGDMVEIPIGVKHGVQVLGTDPVVMFESAIVDLTVSHWNASVDGAISKENVARKLKSLGYHYVEQQYAPGTVFHEHSHEHHTKDAVVTGQLKVSMQGKEVVLGPGDILDIPGGIDHNAAVIGSDPVTVLEAEKGHIHRVHWNELVDGALTAETMTHKLRSHGYDAQPAVTFAPGTVHDEHAHQEARVDAVLAGCLKVTLFGQEIMLNPGDFLEIPCGVDHTAKVVSAEPVSIIEGTMGLLMVDAWNAAVDGELNEANFARKLKARGYHYTRHTLAPGHVAHDHAHEEHRKEGVLSGSLKFSMIGKEVILKPGDLICVPIGVDHNTAVVGAEPAVVLDAVRGDVRLERWDAAAHGPLSADAVIANLRSRGYHNCVVSEHKPGTVLHEHAHEDVRKDAVISGSLKVGIFGKEVVLKPGDIISIPEGIDHDATVVGDESVIVVEAAR